MVISDSLCPQYLPQGQSCMSVKMLRIGIILPWYNDPHRDILNTECPTAGAQQSLRGLLNPCVGFCPKILSVSLPGQADTPGSILRKAKSQKDYIPGPLYIYIYSPFFHSWGN